MSTKRPFLAVTSLIVLIGSACAGGASDTLPPFEQTSPTTSNTTSTSSFPTTAAAETIDDFLDGFIGALNTGNPVFLIQRIHPQLRDYYGREACRAVYSTIVADDTAKVSIRSVSGPDTWTEVFDGTEFTFSDVYTVDAEFIDFGWNRRQDLKLALIDERFYFFEDCGDPPRQAPTSIPIEQLDPDGDGFFYVHQGSGDSEDFQVPALFRITYTGSATTCGFQLLDAATGEEIRYVAGLDGGGIKRIVLGEPLSTVYISDVLGCQGGVLQVGPNP